MASKESIDKKKQRVNELSKLIQFRMANARVPVTVKEQIENEQFKLEFRMMELEDMLQDAKVQSMEKVLEHLKPYVSKN